MRKSTANHAEREAFFNTELIDLIPNAQTDLIMAGDFNCVLANRDCTLIVAEHWKGLSRTSVWSMTGTYQQTYTHYTPTGAARLHRICYRRLTTTNARSGDNSSCLYRSLSGTIESGYDNPVYT